jgi:hypothetical protein
MHKNDTAIRISSKQHAMPVNIPKVICTNYAVILLANLTGTYLVDMFVPHERALYIMKRELHPTFNKSLQRRGPILLYACREQPRDIKRQRSSQRTRVKIDTHVILDIFSCNLTGASWTGYGMVGASEVVLHATLARHAEPNDRDQ